ncbi:hypothetical protein PoB_003494100 [Plakobranchus ocellatus]|uniref:Uncharacterized protein n=1 Tax=Plakobranchus ocellatus TaxID=259542 RepID=A0AAV4AJH2_9GAST|nr:hypothetical protein PoB_003494100 [Plakobranchus ocellatus]
MQTAVPDFLGEVVVIKYALLSLCRGSCDYHQARLHWRACTWAHCSRTTPVSLSRTLAWRWGFTEFEVGDVSEGRWAGLDGQAKTGVGANWGRYGGGGRGKAHEGGNGGKKGRGSEKGGW